MHIQEQVRAIADFVERRTVKGITEKVEGRRFAVDLLPAALDVFC